MESNHKDKNRKQTIMMSSFLKISLHTKVPWSDSPSKMKVWRL